MTDMALTERKKLEIRALADASYEALMALVERAPIETEPSRKFTAKTRAWPSTKVIARALRSGEPEGPQPYNVILTWN